MDSGTFHSRGSSLGNAIALAKGQQGMAQVNKADVLSEMEAIAVEVEMAVAGGWDAAQELPGTRRVHRDRTDLMSMASTV
jgi:hypothetical protein